MFEMPRQAPSSSAWDSFPKEAMEKLEHALDTLIGPSFEVSDLKPRMHRGKVPIVILPDEDGSGMLSGLWWCDRLRRWNTFDERTPAG